MRLVASIRLSRDSDTTNAPVTQREDIQGWVDNHPGHMIVAWTEDIDVSGGMPIRERPGVGRWLDDDHLALWDGLIGKDLDRLFRSTLDYLLWIRDFGKKSGKVVIDVAADIDTSTSEGYKRLLDRARDAEFERLKDGERRARAAKQIRQEGRYGGGPYIFGLTKQRYETGEIDRFGKPKYAYRLVKHEPYANEAKAVVDRILSGDSPNSVVMDLNRRGVPTSRDAQRILEGKPAKGAVWTTTQLIRYLKSPALKGFVLNYRKDAAQPVIVYGRDGLPVRRAAIVDDDTWEQVQEALSQGKTSGKRRNVATMLLRVAFCADCQRAMHYVRTTARGSVFEYYGCYGRHYEACASRLIPMKALDEALTESFLATYGHLDDYRRKFIKGSERERKIKEVGQAIADLTAERFVQGIVRPDYDALMAKLQAEHLRLSNEPPEPPKVKKVKTGKTVAEVWHSLDKESRRRWLISLGVKAFVKRDADGLILVMIEGGALDADLAA